MKHVAVRSEYVRTYIRGAARLLKFSSRLAFDWERKKERKNMFSTSSTSSAADDVTIWRLWRKKTFN